MISNTLFFDTKELAAFLGISHSSYRNIERGNCEVGLDKLFSIAYFLNEPPAILLEPENAKEYILKREEDKSLFRLVEKLHKQKTENNEEDSR